MTKGDIILVPFPFTDLTGSKIRPATVLVNGDLDITVSFVSTQLQWKEEYDIVMNPDKHNNFKKISLIRLSKNATLDRDLVLGKLGIVEGETIIQLDKNLKLLFKLV